jgi:single stranded DNA-binding protein
MYRDTNCSILGGRLVSDPETKTINGEQLVKFRIVSNSGIEEGPSTNTLYIDCEWWGSNKGSQYLEKGKKVEIIGRLQMSHWTDKETGIARSRAYIKVNNLELRGKKPDSENESASNDFIDSLTENA